MKILVLLPVLLAINASAAQIAEYFRSTKKLEPQTMLMSYNEPIPTHGITEFGIERTPCYGTCPVYSVIIKHDGTFTYNGIKHTKRTGIQTGKIYQGYFARTALFIHESGYMKFGEDYEYKEMVTDNPSTYITVVQNGVRKTVRFYGNSAPNNLWVTGQLIDQLLEEAFWDEKKSTEAPVESAKKK